MHPNAILYEVLPKLVLWLCGPCALRAQLFDKFVNVHGVLVRLFAEFVSRQMIPLAVSRGGRGVGVGREVMEFCSSIVRALWHGVPPAILDVLIG
jgi:hypothetical protein